VDLTETETQNMRVILQCWGNLS